MTDQTKQAVYDLENPDFSAWFTAFFLKNHIDPFAYTAKVASREQIEFMVYPENDERYYPCSDRMFNAIMSRKYPPYLKKQYEKVLARIISMIDELIDLEYDNRFLKALVKIKYEDEIRTGLLIPSRLEKACFDDVFKSVNKGNPFELKKTVKSKRKRSLQKSSSSPYNGYQKFMALKRKMKAGQARRDQNMGITRVEKIESIKPVNPVPGD